MAFPVVEATASTPVTTSGPSASVVMPAGIVAGQLLLAYVVSVQTQTPSTGWTPLGLAASGMSVYGRVAAGGETLTITFGANSTLRAVTYRISGATTNIDDIGRANQGGSLNPPSLDMGASRDHLWIVGARNNTTSPTVPASYTGLVVVIGTNPRIACAHRQLTAQTEDPATFGGSPGSPSSMTVGIPPAAPPAAGSFWPFFS